MILRRTCAVLAGLLLLGLGHFPAQATTDTGVAVIRDGCEATHYHQMTRGGDRLRIYIRYYARAGGTNCAWVEKLSGTGTPTDLGIRMAKCRAGNYAGASSCPSDGGWAPERGNYRIYAGPVWRTGTSMRCIWIQIANRGSGWGNPFAIHHCG
jgi:hypothetical protein